MSEWCHEFNIDDIDAPISYENQKGKNKRIALLSEMIEFCIERTYGLQTISGKFMKVKNYSYETFPDYDQEIPGAIELKGNRNNLRCRMLDVPYQDNCIIRFLFPNTILSPERKYPLVIHVQGSGWYKQDMNDHIFDFMPLVKRGFAYAIIQYHHSPEAKFPTQIIDTKKAIRYIQEHAAVYPIKSDQLFLSGDSSGGHTALMTLVTYNQSVFDVKLARVHDADHGRSIFYSEDVYECIEEFLKSCL